MPKQLVVVVLSYIPSPMLRGWLKADTLVERWTPVADRAEASNEVDAMCTDYPGHRIIARLEQVECHPMEDK